MYIVASATPVTSSTMNAVSVAIPSTYHHPYLNDVTWAGTRCFAWLIAARQRPVRSSSQSPTLFSAPITRCSVGEQDVSCERNGARAHLDHSVPNPRRVVLQGLLGRARGHFAVKVKHAPVTGTHEE